jgi:hypothetical protein
VDWGDSNGGTGRWMQGSELDSRDNWTQCRLQVVMTVRVVGVLSPAEAGGCVKPIRQPQSRDRGYLLSPAKAGLGLVGGRVIGWLRVMGGELRVEVSHPGDKNKNVARMGHPDWSVGREGSEGS